MSEPVYTSETPLACAAGMPGCDCDRMSPESCDALGYPRGYIRTFCECHDCYVCGDIDCGGHEK
jgi:hypothetical protein